MPMRTPDRESLHIEIYVSREPGSLSVSSYSDFKTRTLEQAIGEAEAFIVQCRAVQADIAGNGLGERPPAEPTALSVDAIIQLWDTATTTRMDSLFGSPALFRSLVKR